MKFGLKGYEIPTHRNSKLIVLYNFPVFSTLGTLCSGRGTLKGGRSGRSVLRKEETDDPIFEDASVSHRLPDGQTSFRYMVVPRNYRGCRSFPYKR